MNRWLTFAVSVELGLYLSSCTPGSTLTLTAPTSTTSPPLGPTAMRSLPTATPSRPQPTPSAIPATPTPTLPPPEFPETPPPFLYIHNDVLYELVPGQVARPIAELPEGTRVWSSARVGEMLFLMLEAQLVQVNLETGSYEVAIQYDAHRGGSVLARESCSQLAIMRYVYVSPDTVSAVDIAEIDDTGVGLIREVLLPGKGPVFLRGESEDCRFLYLTQSSEPEFAAVQVIDLRTAEISREVPENSTGEPIGFSFAALSPDDRVLATIAYQAPLPGGGPGPWGIRLFDLAEGAAGGRWVDTPLEDTHPWGFAWSPDSQWLYFLVRSGNDPNTLVEAPVGLWRLDVRTGSASRLGWVDDPWSSDLAVSRDGNWLLVWGELIKSATVMHVPTAASAGFSFPEPYLIVGWR